MTATTDPRAEAALTRIRAMLDAAANSCNACDIFRGWSKIRSGATETEIEQSRVVAAMALAYWLEALLNKEPVEGPVLDDFCACASDLRDRMPDFGRQQAITQLITHAGLLQRAHPQRIEGPRHAIIAAYEAYGDMDRACDVLDASRGVGGAEMAQAVVP